MLPDFSKTASGGPEGEETLVISAPEDSGLLGYWSRRFPVESGKFYQFEAYRKVSDVPTPARSAVVKIDWVNGDGTELPEAFKETLINAESDRARPVFPAEREDVGDGWVRIRGTYRVPEHAKAAAVELQLRWAPGGKVEWALGGLEKVEQPSRPVRLAAVHYRPSGGTTARENREQFAPYIEKAAEQDADLVVLGECLTRIGNGLSFAEAAEPIPGPSTEYFGKLARRHGLFIVAGLVEKDGSDLYNVAVLMGREGELIGKYRKVCLPRSEIDAGLTPGQEYPVFETALGKVGMMVCWDVHFPEVARNLARNGAEIIAMPIWGGMPKLAQARAIENQIYLVTSTYTDHERDWMKTAVWDYSGNRMDTADEWGEVVVTEVDLEAERYWRGIGDFKGRIWREGPSSRAKAE